MCTVLRAVLADLSSQLPLKQSSRFVCGLIISVHCVRLMALAAVFMATRWGLTFVTIALVMIFNYGAFCQPNPVPQATKSKNSWKICVYCLSTVLLCVNYCQLPRSVSCRANEDTVCYYGNKGSTEPIRLKPGLLSVCVRLSFVSHTHIRSLMQGMFV